MHIIMCKHIRSGIICDNSKLKASQASLGRLMNGLWYVHTMECYRPETEQVIATGQCGRGKLPGGVPRDTELLWLGCLYTGGERESGRLSCPASSLNTDHTEASVLGVESRR